MLIVLGIFGIWVCWPMVGQYQSKQTSLSQSKADVQERPTITICFETRNLNSDDDGDDKTVNYGSQIRFTLNEDFTIAYSSGKDPEFTKCSNIGK